VEEFSIKGCERVRRRLEGGGERQGKHYAVFTISEAASSVLY